MKHTNKSFIEDIQYDDQIRRWLPGFRVVNPDGSTSDRTACVPAIVRSESEAMAVVAREAPRAIREGKFNR